MRPTIPQADPHAEFSSCALEIQSAIKRVLARGQYILGEEVRAFEREFANYLGVKYAIGVGNGTDALHLALRALDIGKGDEVITVSHTATATAAAIVQTGARPRFVDIDPATYTLDPTGLPATLSSRTRAIIPVHLYGLPADMGPIM